MYKPRGELWYDGNGKARAAWLEKSDHDALCGKLAMTLERVSEALELALVHDPDANPDGRMAACLDTIARTWAETGRYDYSFVVPKH